tara:strand:- start:447 stop:1139 length:693 start_codon:yes stop_codon:yes gene_type:complete
MIAPKISIRGGRFTAVTDVSAEDVSTNISVVIVGANSRLSKSWYKEEWTDDNESNAPDCFSLDGVKPSDNSEFIQSDICVSCPQNAWGSKITPTGNKVKACADQKRLAVVFSDKVEGDVYLLQVTPASLKSLNAYQKELSMRGIVPEIVKTKIAFEVDSPFPKLRFSFGGFNSDHDQTVVDKYLGTDEVKIITGELAVPSGTYITSTASSYGFTEEFGFTLNEQEGGSYE